MRASYGAMVARKIGWVMRTRPASIDWAGGVASFTFDDFPRSALVEGGAVLEKYGLRGTFYTAVKLAGTENHLGPMFETDDLSRAHKAGHEIACHTLTHRDCCRASAVEIAEEVTENSAAIAALTEGSAPASFAYPFGAVSLTAKRALARRFATCRSTGQGINHGRVDLTDLLGVRVYNTTFNADFLRGVVDQARASNGWVIFFTHDVSERPSHFGCTPVQLETVVSYAAARLPVLPVREVADRAFSR